MASRQQVRDGIAEILGHENYARGIEVKENNGVIDIDMYIIVSYGVKNFRSSKQRTIISKIYT